MLVLIFLLLLLPRLYIIFNSPYTFYSDDAIYAVLARSLTEGQLQYIFHPTWPPLYPSISAFFILLIPGFENALRVVSVIFGTAIIIPLFFLLRKTVSLQGAISFIFALSLFTSLQTLSLLPLSDSLAVFLIISGSVSVFFALLHLNTRLGTKLLLLGSFNFGLAFLTRTEGTMFFFLTLGYLIFYGVLKYRTKAYFLTVLAFVFVFFLTISPYLLAIKNQIGEWSLSQKFSAQLQQGHMFALNKQGTTWAQEIDSAKFPSYSSLYYKNGTEYLLDRLYSFMQQYPQKQTKWINVFLSIFPIWALVLILAGALASFLDKKHFWQEFYIVFLLLLAVPITIFSTPMQDIRYLAWAIPIFLYLFYKGINAAIRKKNFAALLTFLAVLTFPGVSVTNIIDPSGVAVNFNNTYNKYELKDAGLWIKNNSKYTNPKLMMRHEGVEFYSGGETIYMPQTTYEEVLKYAKKNGVEFIVAWDEELAADEQLKVLLDREVKHPGLMEVYFTKGKGQIILYSLQDI